MLISVIISKYMEYFVQNGYISRVRTKNFCKKPDKTLCDATVLTLLHIATVQNCEVCVHKSFHAFCSSRANPVCRFESGNPYHIWFILAILDIQQGLRHRIRSHHSKCQNENLHSPLAPDCKSNNFSSLGPKEICICKLAGTGYSF